jgi:hypothetical protein
LANKTYKAHYHAQQLVMIDWFTKYPIMRPQAMAKKVVEIVEVQVFLSHGVPEIVIANNGSQFISKEFNEPRKVS